MRSGVTSSGGGGNLMLRIRTKSMDAFRSGGIAAARRKIVAALRESRPVETARYGPAELEALCDRGILRADRYDIGTEYNVYVFVGAMLVFGEDFDTNERTKWSRDVLNDAHVDENAKATLLEMRILLETERGM